MVDLDCPFVNEYEGGRVQTLRQCAAEAIAENSCASASREVERQLGGRVLIFWASDGFRHWVTEVDGLVHDYTAAQLDEGLEWPVVLPREEYEELFSELIEERDGTRLDRVELAE